MNKEYQIFKNSFDQYLRKAEINWYIRIVLISILVIGIFGIIIFENTGSLDALIAPLVVLSLVVFFSIQYWKKQLKEFENARFLLAENSISLEIPEKETTTLIFEKIKIIHIRKIGTLIVSGGNLMKVRYIQSLLGGLSYTPWMPLIKKNQIFIPSSTLHYDELLEQIKSRTVNVWKI